MVKIVFSPDIHRNYCENDVINYHNILLKLSSSCKFPYKILGTLLEPLNTHESWRDLQKLDTNIDDIYKEYNTVYVFFEIPEYLRLYFINNNIRYVNFMTSKLRFPGIEPCIMFESNIIDIQYKPYLDYPKYSGNTLPEYKGKTVAIGQMYADRSVIFDGISKDIFDYEFKADIFRPHPLTLQHQVKYSDELNLKAKKRGIQVITDGNIYDIINSAEAFVAISSSTLYEAQYLGKQVMFLQEKDYIKAGNIIKWSDIDDTFWQSVICKY